MKQLLLGLFSLVFSVQIAVSQLPKKTAVEKSLNLPYNADIVSINVVKDKFFVVKTASNYLRKTKNGSLHYFSADLKKTWSANIDAKSKETIVVASEFTPYIYHIDGNSIFIDTKVTRLDSNGKITQFKLSSKYDFERGERKIAYFSTSSKLCMLSVSDYESTRKVSVTVNKKKTKVTLAKSYLVLSMINHNEKRMYAKKIKIPFESRISNAPVHFELLAQQDSIFYVLKKERGSTPNLINLCVYVFNELGDLKDTKEWVVDAKNYVVPIFNVREANGAYVCNLDYDKQVSSSSNASGGTTTTTTVTISAGSYGSCYLDLDKDHFYLLSFTSDKSNATKRIVTSTYDFLKEDLKQIRLQKYQYSTGKLLEEMESNLPDDISKDAYWSKVKLLGVHLMDMGDKNFKVALLGLKDSYVFYFNTKKQDINYYVKAVPEGSGFKELNDRYERKTYQTNLLLSRAFSKSDYLRYLQSFPSWREKECSINGIDLGKSMVVIRNSAFAPKNPSISFRLFAK
ncbi:MAG: hypothetical protein K9I36_07685 [Bacteroidia bacterium]|nr:hypothetical protein [Bacteroidia bacterium]